MLSVWLYFSEHLKKVYSRKIKRIIRYIKIGILCIFIVECYAHSVNPWRSELYNSNFHPLEVVSRYRDPKLQVSENFWDCKIWVTSYNNSVSNVRYSSLLKTRYMGINNYKYYYCLHCTSKVKSLVTREAETRVIRTPVRSGDTQWWSNISRAGQHWASVEPMSTCCG